MAGRGPARRTSGATADARNGQQHIDAKGLSVTVPPKPRGLTAPLLRAWADFWSSDVAVLLQRSDLHAVRRLFELYVEREQCHRTVQQRQVTRLPLDQALSSGATGELVHQIDDEGKTHTFVLVAHEGRVGIGSQGQMVLSPWARDLRTIDSEIRQLEDRFGLNLRARAALAVSARPAPTPPPSHPPADGPAGESDRDLLDL